MRLKIGVEPLQWVQCEFSRSGFRVSLFWAFVTPLFTSFLSFFFCTTFGDDFSITFVFAFPHDLWWDLKEALYFSIDFRQQPSSELQAFGPSWCLVVCHKLFCPFQCLVFFHKLLIAQDFGPFLTLCYVFLASSTWKRCEYGGCDGK
jgi:hypothetical protein